MTNRTQNKGGELRRLLNQKNVSFESAVKEARLYATLHGLTQTLDGLLATMLEYEEHLEMCLHPVKRIKQTKEEREAEALEKWQKLTSQLRHLVKDEENVEAAVLFAEQNYMMKELRRLRPGWVPQDKKPAKAEKVVNRIRVKRAKHSAARCNHHNMDDKDRVGHRSKMVATRKRAG